MPAPRSCAARLFDSVDVFADTVPIDRLAALLDQIARVPA
jgi:hypothetical protein